MEKGLRACECHGGEAEKWSATTQLGKNALHRWEEGGKEGVGGQRAGRG